MPVGPADSRGFVINHETESSYAYDASEAGWSEIANVWLAIRFLVRTLVVHPLNRPLLPGEETRQDETVRISPLGNLENASSDDSAIFFRRSDSRWRVIERETQTITIRNDSLRANPNTYRATSHRASFFRSLRRALQLNKNAGEMRRRKNKPHYDG